MLTGRITTQSFFHWRTPPFDLRQYKYPCQITLDWTISDKPVPVFCTPGLGVSFGTSVPGLVEGAVSGWERDSCEILAASENDEHDATSAPEYSKVWQDMPPMGSGCILPAEGLGANSGLLGPSTGLLGAPPSFWLSVIIYSSPVSVSPAAFRINSTHSPASSKLCPWRW